MTKMALKGSVHFHERSYESANTLQSNPLLSRHDVARKFFDLRGKRSTVIVFLVSKIDEREEGTSILFPSNSQINLELL